MMVSVGEQTNVTYPKQQTLTNIVIINHFRQIGGNSAIQQVPVKSE